jgi:hypothetical protein
MEYTIVTAAFTNVLIGRVTEKINQGWAPTGGVAQVQGESQTYFIQAMTRIIPSFKSTGPR